MKDVRLWKERRWLFFSTIRQRNKQKKGGDNSVIAQNPLFPGSESTFQHVAQRQTAFFKKCFLTVRTATTFSENGSKIKSVCHKK